MIELNRTLSFENRTFDFVRFEFFCKFDFIRWSNSIGLNRTKEFDVIRRVIKVFIEGYRTCHSVFNCILKRKRQLKLHRPWDIYSSYLTMSA